MRTVAIQALLPVLEGHFWGDSESIFEVAELHLDLTILLEVAADKVEAGCLLHPILLFREGCAKHAHRVSLDQLVCLR